MTEKDREIQELRRELELAKAEIKRLNDLNGDYWEQIEYQRTLIDNLMEASR